jgi:hypothetical protein
MVVPKIISTRLRKIEYLADESKSACEAENQLIDLYLRMHHEVFQTQQETEKFRSDYEHGRDTFEKVKAEFYSLESQRKNMIADSLKILPEKIKYPAFRIALDKVFAEHYRLSIIANKFLAHFAQMEQELKALIEYRDRLVDFFRKEMAGNLNRMADLLEEIEAYPYGTSLDLTSFCADDKLFSEISLSVRSDILHIVDKVDYCVRMDINPFMVYFNEGATAKAMHEALVSLSTAHKFYVDAEEIERLIFWFDWDINASNKVDDLHPRYGFVHDIEFDLDGNIKLHIDIDIIAEGVFWISERVSFLLKCAAHEVYTMEILEPLVGHALDIVRDVVALHAKDKGYNLNINKLYNNYDLVRAWLTYILNTNPSSKNEWEKAIGFKPAYKITLPGIYDMPFFTVVFIMDQLLLENKQYDNWINRMLFEKIVPIAQYKTLKLKLDRITKGDFYLNLRQCHIFMMILEGSRQLLTGNHKVKFINELNKAGINAEDRNVFLEFSQAEQKHVKGLLDSINLTIKDFDKKIDWNSIFFH